jgi:hypothetical protein
MPKPVPARIVDVYGTVFSDENLPHGVDPIQVGDGRHFWSVNTAGIALLGRQSVLRTPGQPATLRRIKKAFGELIDKATGDVRAMLLQADLAALVATESGGNPNAERNEPSIKDVSIGLCQTLTGTAKFLGKKLGILLPAKSLPEGGKLEHWRAALRDPWSSLRLGAEYFSQSYDGDPMLAYAAYNAGGIYASTDNPWGLRAYDRDGMGPEKGALDWYAAWFGDACAVYG